MFCPQRRRTLLAIAALATPLVARADDEADGDAQRLADAPAPTDGSAAAPAGPPAPAATTPVPPGTPYHLRDDVREFLDGVAEAHGIDRQWLDAVSAQGRYSEQAERLTTPSLAPPAARNWAEYRARNVDERRIRDGAVFLRRHRAALARAWRQFGVPEEIVVAIIGIETVFGRNTGSFRTLDVLLTLAFDYPRRAGLYRDELAQFLLLCHEQGLDPLAQRGSFAGAVGLPQFMPGSIRRWAVDFDGDGKVDLHSEQDAIGSVANFLAAHGWQRDAPVSFRAQTDASVAATLRSGITAGFRWADVQALGVSIDGELEPDTPVLLMDLPLRRPGGEEAVDYRVGTVNLSALLHYNRSYFYAAAVAELARAIRLRASA